MLAGLQVFFKDWWAESTHGAKNGSFSEMMGPKQTKLNTVDIWVVYFTYIQTLICMYVY